MSKITNLKAILAMSVLLLGIACTNSAGRTIYVDAQASGNNDGTYWVDAYNCLQDALADAQAGDEIWVAKGIYKPDQGKGIKPGDRNATFKLKNGVSIYGGFPTGGGKWADSDPSTHETILSGDLNDDDAEVAAAEELPHEPTRSENSYHVVTAIETDATAVLDGFVITAGNAGKDTGGGMHNDSASPTVKNCAFIANSAMCGGGMYNQRDSSPTLTDCIFSKNATKCCGAGIRNCDSSPVLTNCTFTNNSARYGAGMRSSYSNPSLTNCAFTRNSTRSSGGAIQNHRSNPTFRNCTFRGNSAGDHGGAIYNCTSDPTLTNCIVSGNSTQKDGGGIFNCKCGSNPTLVNCTFSGNAAKYQGGAVCSRKPSNPTLTNCILWGNSDRDGTGESAQIHGVRAAVNHCCIQDWKGNLGGIGNFDADPLFARYPDNGGDDWGDNPETLDIDEGANDDYGDLHLSADSPCIDAGDNTAVPSSAVTDLDGNPRIIGGNVDIGADEYGR